MNEPVEIIDFSPEYKEDFKNLNVAWIQKYFTLEPSDIAQLENPEKHILENGGHILLAKIGLAIVGTTALVKDNDDFFELVKMAVDERFQGQRIGEKLAIAAIAKAKALGAKQLFLESNRKLTAALNLYRKMGFKEVKLHESPYARADIQMILDL